MPRHDEPRELGHDDIVDVANECLAEGVDAHEIALILWRLRPTLGRAFGPRYCDIHREAFQTWKRSIVERDVVRGPDRLTP